MLILSRKENCIVDQAWQMLRAKARFKLFIVFCKINEM